jgi:hypothetical protein
MTVATAAEIVALVERGTVRRVTLEPADRDATLEVVYGVTVPPHLEDVYAHVLKTNDGGATLLGRRFDEIDSDGASPTDPNQAWSVIRVRYAADAAAGVLPLQVGPYRIGA